MLAILSITGPIFLTIGLGFTAARLHLFSRNELQVLGRFVITFALPALLFKSLAERELHDVLNLGYLWAYATGSLATLSLGYLWSRKVSGQEHRASTFAVMGMSCSNSGFIGYPILLLAMEPIAATAFALNLLVEQLLMLPLLLTMAEYKRGAGRSGLRVIRRALLRVFKHPMILALIAGFFVSLLGWRLPAAVAITVGMFAQACGALALFIVGGSLYASSTASMGWQVAPIAVGKLVIHPLAVFLAHLALPIIGLPTIALDLRTAAVLTAAVPMLSTYTILAQAYGEDAVTAPAMLATTIASFFTLSGLLYLLL